MALGWKDCEGLLHMEGSMCRLRSPSRSGMCLVAIVHQRLGYKAYSDRFRE